MDGSGLMEIQGFQQLIFLPEIPSGPGTTSKFNSIILEPSLKRYFNNIHTVYLRINY
jgi:hypothetical protein